MAWAADRTTLVIPRVTRSLGDTRGLTLPEILVAMAVLTIGLLGAASAMIAANGGVAAGISGGQAAIERGFVVSTATELAQARLEQIKRLQWASNYGATEVDEIIAPTPAGFADEAFGGITGYPNYSRQVRVYNAQPAANMKTITVTVRYRYASASGMTEEGLTLGTVVAKRP